MADSPVGVEVLAAEAALEAGNSSRFSAYFFISLRPFEFLLHLGIQNAR